MSFSKRDSKWANAALVVSLSPEDVARDVTAMEGADAGNGPLRGVRWQSAMERRAAEMGGGNLGESLFRRVKASWLAGGFFLSGARRLDCLPWRVVQSRALMIFAP